MPEPAAVVITAETAGSQRRVQRWSYVGGGLFVILLSFAGFAPSIIDQSRRNASPTPLVIAHGAVSLAWLLLFLTQATLVATRRVAVHRRLGWVGPALAAAVIVLGFFTSIEVTRRAFDLSGDVTRAVTPPGVPPPTEAENIAGVWGPLGVLVDFSILVVAGLWYRHRPEIHKCLMVFALLPLAFESILHLVGVLVGRVPASQGVILGAGVAFTLLLFSVPAIHDKVSQGRIHPVSVWVPIASFVWTIVVNVVVSPSVAGYRLAAWLVR